MSVSETSAVSTVPAYPVGSQMPTANTRPQLQSENALQFLTGGGEMGALMRRHDWASTPLGPPAHWPQSLKTAARIMLTSRQPIWIGWGKELTYLYNDAYKSIIGGKHPWALGRPTSEVWREIWDDIGPMLDAAMCGIEGTYVEEQLLIMERNGYPEETYYTFSYTPIPNDDGGTGGIICANTDDTQRVIGERQLASLRELATTILGARSWREICDRSTAALGSNRRDLPFAMLYMCEPDGKDLSLVGAAGFDQQPANLAPSLALPWPTAEVLRDREPRVVSDLRQVFGVDMPRGEWTQQPTQAAVLPILPSGESGRAGVLIVGLNPFRLFDENYRGFLGLAAGQISAALAAAQAYEQEQRRAAALAEIDRAKTTFFSNISHEFRTPLTLMLGPLEDSLAAANELPRKEVERVQVAHRNGMRLLKLVNSLLDFARIEAKRTQANFEPTELSALTAELASNFRSATEKAGMNLRVNCPPLPEVVYVDREMWEKIVLNLVSNAFKFTFEGEIAVEVRPAADKSAAELVVSDTGTGIPREELPRLFERFHRVEGARGRTFEGSGIGLALVHELVKQHSGSIRVESDVGRGSTFTVSVPFGIEHLPRERAVTRSPQHPSGTRAEAYVQEALRWLPESEAGSESTMTPVSDDLSDDVVAPRGNGERILLADDNADMRDYIRRLLHAQGYQVATVENGEAALAAARHQRPDLVLSDVMMPRLDGFGLLAKLRDDPNLRQLPIILLSARAGEEARIEGLDAGADDYVSKPFSARELLARVRTNLQLARIRKDAEEAQRQHAARLEAVVNTVPTAVWFTHDPEARQIFGNAHGAQLLRLSPDSNASLSAPMNERPSYRVFHNGNKLAAAELPLQRAARGEYIRDEELQIRFDDGSSVVLLVHASPILDSSGVIQGAVCGAIDMTERKRQEAHRNLLINELNHRVKNTLATVQSFAMQTLRSAKSMVEGRQVFDARLIAMSKAHDVLVRENWEGARLYDVVSEALAAYSGNSSNPRLRFKGPEVRLQPKSALALSMALHELATNALKYGALSDDTGRVEVSWAVEDSNQFKLRWAESGGPIVVTPSRRGFGSRLIEQGLSQDLGGEVRLDFEARGVICTIHAPLDEIRERPMTEPAVEVTVAEETQIGS